MFSRSTVAAHDCNCRCFLEYDYMTEKEFAEASNQTVEQVREKYGDKSLENSENGSIIELTRNKGYTHRKVSTGGYQVIDKPTYNKLTKKFRDNDGIIIRGKEAEIHLEKMGATASYLPSFNTAFIKDEATVSDVLEEMYHAEQDRTNMFGKVMTDEVKYRREIDAQNYLLSVADKYNIPDSEIKVTKSNLAIYKKRLEELLNGSD